MTDLISLNPDTGVVIPLLKLKARSTYIFLVCLISVIKFNLYIFLLLNKLFRLQKNV